MMFRYSTVERKKERIKLHIQGRQCKDKTRQDTVRHANMGMCGFDLILLLLTAYLL